MSSANVRPIQPGMAAGQPWHPVDGLLIEKMGDEFLVLDKSRGKIHQFNSSAGVVWQGVMEGASVDAMAASLVEQFDVPMERALRDVQTLLEELEFLKLIEGQAARQDAEAE